MRSFIFFALLAGCTTLPPLESNVCGNGILETGEDCDSTDPHCVKCAIVCTTVMDCPAGYACGTGGTCAAASGKLVAPRAIDTVSFDDLRATDVDKDGIADMIGLSATSLSVRFGDPVSPLATNVSLTTPSQIGTAGWGDLDGDGSLDLILPTPDGLVAYTSTYGVLSPLAVPSGIGATDDNGAPDPNIQILAMVRFQDQVFGALAYDPVVSVKNPVPQVVLVVVDLRSTTGPIAGGQICNLVLTPDQIDRDALEVYDASNGTDGEFVIGVVATTDLRHECLLNLHLDPPPTPPFGKPVGPASGTVSPITAVAPKFARQTFLANLQFFATLDACPSLVTQEAHQTMGDLMVTAFPGSHVAAGTTPAHCAIDFTSPKSFPLPGERPDATVIGRFPLNPPITSIGGDALVTDDSVYAYWALTNAGLLEYQSARPLKAVASADLNGDGFVDAVLLPAGTDDLDILYRVHDASVNPNVDGYQLARFDTAAEVTHLVIGDYDGNGIQDLAYTELAGDHVRAMVAYSTRDGVLPPVQVASFANVLTMMPIGFPSSDDPVSQAEDLIIGIPSSNAATPDALELTLLLGSASRTLTPVLDPRSGDDQKWSFHNVSIGHFGGTFVDAFGLAYNSVAVSTAMPGTAATPFEGWPIMGTANGLDPTATDGVPITGVAPPCNSSESTTPDGTGVCMDGETVSVPIAAGHDVVIAIDRYGRGGVVNPVPPLGLVSFDLGLSAGAKRVRALFAQDLDGDGALDLVATFEGTVTHTGSVFTCKLDKATGAPSGCHDVAATVKAVDATITSCVDATTGQFSFIGPTSGAPVGTDLVVACETPNGTGLYRITGTTVTKLRGDLPSADLLRSGDIDGDGVTDLVLVHGPPGDQTLSVLRQCTSRDATCQESP